MLNKVFSSSRKRQAVLVVAAGLAMPVLRPASSRALESDQYYAWGREIADSAAPINAKFNLEIARAVEEVNSRQARGAASCRDVMTAVMRRLRFLIFTDIEMWALNSAEIDRVPSTPEEELEYRRTNLYHDRAFLDMAGWIPNVPTIEADGIRFGTDKLAHFVGEGWRYYLRYRRHIRHGLAPAEAELRAIRMGVFAERTLLGGVTTGVFSLGDLEADYRGMLFYLSICSGDDPLVEMDNGHWQVRRAFDIADYLSPEWDESYEVPIFAERRWKRVEPILRQYADKLNDPRVQARRRLYRQLDRVTPTERVVADLIREGRLEDPRRFSLEPDCPDLLSPPGSEEKSPRGLGGGKTHAPDQSLMEELREREDFRAWRSVGLRGMYAAYPSYVSASVGVLMTHIPAEYSAKTLCALEGPLFQLEPGIAGGRVACGWASVYGEQTRNSFFLSHVYLAYAFKAVAYCKWGDPPSGSPGQTYVGGEVEATLVQVNFRAGAAYRVAGDADGSPLLISVGLGWGF